MRPREPQHQQLKLTMSFSELDKTLQIIQGYRSVKSEKKMSLKRRKGEVLPTETEEQGLQAAEPG